MKQVQKMKCYQLREELAPLLGISDYTVVRRKKELLEWLKNFYDYELISEKPYTLQIIEIYGDYQKMPKKWEKNELQKKQDYENYVIAALGVEFKPNSRMRVAREAILDFDREKYSHTNPRAVTSRFVKEPFEKYGETDNKRIWVWSDKYEPLTKEEVAEWRQILKEEKISEKEAAAAFYKQEQGQDISQEKQYYKNAMWRFQDLHGRSDVPVLVSSWKLNRMGITKITDADLAN